MKCGSEVLPKIPDIVKRNFYRVITSGTARFLSIDKENNM